jgi:16S rRNA (cytosine1402-N4)-methyltransferase
MEELEEIFKTFGEERFSRRIAEKEVEERPVKSTKDLEDIIFHCYPKKMRFGKIHPATRCFQALRIAVNEELGVLTEVLPQLVKLLKPGGRLCVISFHSLEDRIVKRAFKEFRGKESPFKILTKKPITPSKKEIAANSRSRSAKLRVIERI